MPNNIIRQDFGSLGNDVQTQMLIAPVLPTMISDRAYTVGEQFIVDNVLYKITQAVSAAGVALVVDSNCEVSDSITQQIQNQRISYKDVSLGTVTIGSTGYLDIGSYRPTPESGKTLLFVMVYNFGNSGGAIVATTNGQYLMGIPNTNVSYLSLRYFYQ